MSLFNKELDWEFPGGPALETWIRRSPWTNSGETRTALVSDSGTVEKVKSAIEPLITFYNKNSGFVGVETLRSSTGGLQGSIKEALALPEDIVGEDLKYEIAKQLSHRRRVFIVLPDIFDYSEIFELSEILNKGFDFATGCTFLYFVTARGSQSDIDFDLFSGVPISGVLDGSRKINFETWLKYLHHRFSWEAGGNPYLTSEWCEEATIPPNGNDNIVEKMLNEFANCQFEKTDRSIWVDTESHLLNAESSRQPLTLDSKLADAGMFWKPPHASMLQPVPWVARRLLLEGKMPQALASQLRSYLICKPIAREILLRCFELEFFERLLIKESDITPQQLKRIENKSAKSDLWHYPQNCPAIPKYKLDNSTLGEIFFDDIKTIRSKRVAGRELLLDLRNAMAHGCYVSWKSISMLIEAENELLPD